MKACGGGGGWKVGRKREIIRNVGVRVRTGDAIPFWNYIKMNNGTDFETEDQNNGIESSDCCCCGCHHAMVSANPINVNAQSRSTFISFRLSPIQSSDVRPTFVG